MDKYHSVFVLADCFTKENALDEAAEVERNGENMLTECPECKGKVSSEAACCPHCGFPVKGAGAPAPISENIPQPPLSTKTSEEVCPRCKHAVMPNAKRCPHCLFSIETTSEKVDSLFTKQKEPTSTLGTLFILFCIIGLIGGFVAIQPPVLEGMQEELVRSYQKTEQTQRALNNAGFLKSRQDEFDAARDNSRDAQETLQRMRTGRYIKSACWFVPAGILLVTGLILRSSSAKQGGNQRWTGVELTILILISILMPFGGVILGIVGLLQKPKRKQGTILLILSLVMIIMLVVLVVWSFFAFPLR